MHFQLVGGQQPSGWFFLAALWKSLARWNSSHGCCSADSYRNLGLPVWCPGKDDSWKLSLGWHGLLFGLCRAEISKDPSLDQELLQKIDHTFIYVVEIIALFMWIRPAGCKAAEHPRISEWWPTLCQAQTWLRLRNSRGYGSKIGEEHVGI